jgi:hypothetical protein
LPRERKSGRRTGGLLGNACPGLAFLFGSQTVGLSSPHNGRKHLGTATRRTWLSAGSCGLALRIHGVMGLRGPRIRWSAGAGHTAPRAASRQNAVVALSQTASRQQSMPRARHFTTRRLPFEKKSIFLLRQVAIAHTGQHIKSSGNDALLKNNPASAGSEWYDL